MHRTARKVTGLGSVMLSFTGSDVAVCQCGEQGDRNGAVRSKHPLSEVTGFLWFSSSCVSCCRELALKKRARELLDRLSVLGEEFCTFSNVHTAVEVCGMR